MTTQEIEEKINEYNTNGKKTIAYFCDVFYPSIDGVITVVNNLASELNQKYNIVVCAPKHKGKTHFMDKYLVLGASSIKIPSMDYECSINPKADKEFFRLLSLLRIDLIHFHSPFFMGKFAAKFAKKNNIPLVATIHSKYKTDFWLSTHSHILTNILTRNVVKVFNRAQHIITMNKYCEKTFRGYGVKPPITLIGNATNYKSFNNPKASSAIKDLNIKSKNVFLYVGRLVKVKSLPLTLKVMSLLKQKGVDFCFVCVGEGSQLKKLKRIARKYGIENNVVFTGKISNQEKLSAIYSAADLFVFNSTYDTEGLVVLEAAATGTPSIVTANSGPSCRITDNKNGFIANNSAEAFANKICDIIKNKQSLKDVGQNAKKTLPKTWQQASKEYIEFYDKILKS